VKTTVIGLGNTILCDDGIGIYVARALETRLAGAADVKTAELAGFDLIEMLKGYDRAYIVDAINLDGEEPGTVFRMRPDDIRITPRLASFHDIDLVTALALGKRLEFSMPGDVIVYGVQVEDALTLREACTEAVGGIIGPLVEEIAGDVEGRPHRTISIGLAARRNAGA
jgi:hydrogenase maturation protease